MSFFKQQQPILQLKRLSLSDEQLQLMKCRQFKSPWFLPLCGLYTCIDQSMIAWGFISGIIFVSAHLFPLSWLNQAIIWSILTVVGAGITLVLTYGWSKVEGLRWLLCAWLILMVGGVCATDFAIIFHWGWLILNLCSFWLILSSIGYLFTGFALHSRAFFLASFIHLGAIFFLSMVSPWQFLFTGIVMMSNLLIFAEGHWDMILPHERNHHDHSLIVNEKVAL